MKSKKIAIVLVNYNGIQDTKECIESILKSSYNNYKIIVVENNSQDKEHIDSLSAVFPNIYIIKSKENLGFSGGNNLAINYSLTNNFDYILLLNNDTIVDPNMISYLIENANENQITVPKMLYYYEKDLIWYAGGKISKFTGNAKHFKMNSKNTTEVKSCTCTFATGCCMMINSNIFKKVGLLNEKFFMYCEDTEFCLRLLEKEISIRYIPKAILWHKVSRSTGGSNSFFSTYYITRNRLYYIKMHNKFFSPLAIHFTFLSRYVRVIQYYLKKDNNYKAILRAIHDYKKDILGKVNNII
ncbi:MAG: glycosyltransferase family 2 protein [Clostridia bacterium]|nr:glycosyltransferase family 2 protein [Clostridia bacterium]